MTLAHPASPRSLKQRLARLASWFAEALHHAVGNLHDQDRLAPPPIGVQPYRDCPSRAR